MRSVWIVAAAIMALPCVLAADGALPSDAAEAHYRLHVEGSPEGVYEWPERDLIFVHVRIERAKGMTPDKIESAEMTATNRLLHEWLVGKAAVKRVDPVLSFGLECARTTCRKHFPMLEYTANWDFSAQSLYFSSERGSEHTGTTVFRMSDALKSIPAAYIEPVKDGVWLDGLRKVVEKCYVSQGDLAFMWEIGALDSLDASRATAACFPSWDAEDFAARLAAYLDAPNDTWDDAPSPAHDEYAAVRKEMAEYLATSPTALGFLSDAKSLAAPFETAAMDATSPVCLAETNTVASVATNDVAAANVVTNAATIAYADAAGKVATMPWGGDVSVVSVRSDVAEVCEVETVTIIKTTRRTLRRTVCAYTGEPRFERLFLSGGSAANAPSERIPSGLSAEKLFYGKARREEREKAVLNALRENPGDKILWNLYGRILQTRGELPGAVVCFRNALRLDREYEYALANLADAYRSMGKRRLAVGMAMVAYGLAKDRWCIEKAESVLREKL